MGDVILKKSINNPYEPKTPPIVLIVIIVISILGGLVGLCMWNPWLGLIVSILFFIGLLFFGFLGSDLHNVIKIQEKQKESKKRREQKLNKIYGERQTPKFDSFYFGSSHRNGAKLNIIEIIKEGTNIISHKTIAIPTSIIVVEDEYATIYIADYVAKQLEETNYGAEIDIKEKLEDLVSKINKVINKKKIPIQKLTSEHITVFDDEYIKIRRKNNVATMDNDINIAHDIIAKQGYELINVFSGYCLTIVTQEELTRLKKLEEKSQTFQMGL